MDRKSIEYNEKIKSHILKVIDNDGKLIGELNKDDAILLAEEKGLDLVVIASTAIPPVAKLCHLDKYIFEITKKEKQIKKNSKQIELKKIKIGLNIDQNDFNTKIKQAQKFFQEGNNVTFFIKLRKKEADKLNICESLFNRLIESLSEFSQLIKMNLDKSVSNLSLRPISNKK